MSSDPKKLDAPLTGNPDLLQKDLSLDRRRRVPTFDELQAQPTPRAPVGHDAPAQTVEKRVPPGLQPRQQPMPQQGALVPEGLTPHRPPARAYTPVATQPGPPRPQRPPAPVFKEPLLPGEGPVITAEPATLWRRTGAYLTDLLFVGVLVLSLLSIAMAVIAPKTLTPLQQLISIAVPGLGLAAVLAFVYTMLFAVLWSGRTPGRRLMGIHLVDSTGQAPGPARALVRAVLSLVSFGLFLSGFWLALFDRHGQTLHDKLTRTFVVKLQDA